MDSLDSGVLMAPPTTTQVHKESMWNPYVSREPAWNPHGIHVDSRCILAVFWGSENQPGIHEECMGEGKELTKQHLSDEAEAAAVCNEVHWVVPAAEWMSLVVSDEVRWVAVSARKRSLAASEAPGGMTGGIGLLCGSEQEAIAEAAGMAAISIVAIPRTSNVLLHCGWAGKAELMAMES